MRYSIYIYLYNMCGTLQEAAEYIKSNSVGNAGLELLSNCAQVLDAVEQTLRKQEQSVKDSAVFTKLSFCREKMEDILNAMGDADAQEKASDAFAKSTAELKQIYRSNIDITYRILFYAELGQKWDSMSSVYDAFKQRSDCDVAVVLAPIYRAVNVNGEMKTDVIYEDYLTPLGIEHIPYQQYDLSKDVPDLVFISNPYESVTLQQFWPETIAKQTRLVYLPYYTDATVPEESIQVHCSMPVAKYAWRIIAQSLKIKETHQKYAPKQGKNVLVTGLPKWDNIFELKEKPGKLPEDWKNKLSGKKVFLWNSHFSIESDITTLLEYGQKIVDLFSRHDDIALIWRPHPMTATIFKLYCPQYLPFWQNLINLVQKSDNMILDTNTSYNLAFQCSDALISDFSSIMPQYMLTEKPILWLRKAQEAEKNKNKKHYVRIECLEQATDSNKISEFIENIKQGIDSTKDQRLKCMREDMPSADGNIGKRICNLLLSELQQEDGVK